MLASRRTLQIKNLKIGWYSSFGKVEEGFNEEVDPDTNQELKREFSEGGGRGSSTHSSALVKVREFFDKHKPPPSPPPKAPKKEWLLRRLPEPEEMSHKQRDPGPPIGDVEAEREWLDFRVNTSSNSKPLVTESSEFRKMSNEIENAKVTRMAKRSPFNASQRYIPSFESEDRSRSVSWNAMAPVHQDWLNQRGVENHPANKRQSSESLTKQSDAVNDRNENPTGAISRDGFAEILSAMKSRQAQTSTSTNSSKSIDSASPENTPIMSTNQQMDSPLNPSSNQLEDSEADTVYNQIISEDLSEDVMYPKEKDSLDPYDYDPSPPQWLDPPDGDNVGAMPQREYNDFDPFKAEHDFWNESSVEGFEDPGQDPMKPNRHKLFGQEYWVAKPMLMEKYDFDEHEIRGQKEEPKKFKDLDKEIPRHFLREDGSLEPLSISETQEYSSFFDSDAKTMDDSNEQEERLYSMSEKWNKESQKITIQNKQLRTSQSVINGYTFDQNDEVEDVVDEDVAHWLHETPTRRDWGYDKSHSIDTSDMDPDRLQGDMKAEGYGRYEKFIDNSKVAEPSKERIEEIKVLEGLHESFAFQTNQHTLHDEELERPSTKTYYTKASHDDLSRLMNAESWHRDIFTNEKSDGLPTFDDLSEQEKLDSLRKLNKEDGAESRPTNQLLHSPSRRDYDPWMVNELNKHKKADGKFEDLFPLACHPRMLETAFAALKQRRPGSVPRMLDNGFFEQASRMLLMGELKRESPITLRKPGKDAGKGARSRKIFSQPEKRKNEKE